MDRKDLELIENIASQIRDSADRIAQDVKGITYMVFFGFLVVIYYVVKDLFF
jgi:hypothetical protein